MQQLRLRRSNFITYIKGKLTKFSEILTPKYTPPTSYGSFESNIISEVPYHMNISLYLAFGFDG